MSSLPVLRPDPLKLRLVIPGAPRTKKTGQRIVKVGKFSKILPSKAYMDWEKTALSIMAPHVARQSSLLPLSLDLNCEALIYRDAERGDACNYYQAIADMLQKAGVIRNDVLIRQWDGSRLLKDAARPRIVVTLEEIR